MLPGVVVILMGVAGSGKTTVGRALAAALRWPYVDADDYHSRENALKKRYRQALAAGLRSVRFVHLTAPEAVLRERLAGRPDHFARPDLLASQLATLEPPSDALTIDATRPVGEAVSVIQREFGL